MNILHINDLHIKRPDNEHEALREAFYPEYFETLLNHIRNFEFQIDYIFITGDFVDQGKAEYYIHAKKIIDYISMQLSVGNENVYLVNGNHDVSRDSGEMIGFNELLESYENKNLLIDTKKRYRFFQIDNNGIICLDSVGHHYADGTPSSLSNGEKDKIVEIARKNKLNDLFVLSHHPPQSYEVQNQAPFDESQPSWSGKHIWHDGGNLFKRLASRTVISGKVFWFAGDIHRHEHCIIDRYQVLFVTGSINAFDDVDSAISSQLRIVSTEDPQYSKLLEYKFAGHNRKGLEGKWIVSEIKSHNFDTQIKSDKKANLTNNNKVHKSSSQLILIDDELEKDIHLNVVSNGLYEFGRFETNNNVTSLSWVSIHDLLGDYSLYLKIINKFRDKINSLLPVGIPLKDCLLVGVDVWGSIMASRLASSTNIRSCCIAVRSKKDSYDSVERINDELKNIVKEKKILFVISDVIATGNSISTIRKELGCTKCPNWYNLAIFCDPTQERGFCFNGYKETYYICGSIKMPIISKSKLPEENMLSPKISFVR